MQDLSFLNPEYFVLIAEKISYAGIFAMSMLSGYVIPVPEEVMLLVVGYVAGTGPIKLHYAAAISVVGVLIGDNLLYLMSLKGNRYVEKLRHRMRANKLSRYEHLMHDHIGKAIFFLRFVAGVRFFGPVLAGTLKVSWKKFLFFNSTASLIHVAFFVALGYFFRSRFLLLVTEVEVVRHALFFSSAVILGSLITLFARKRFFAKNKD